MAQNAFNTNLVGYRQIIGDYTRGYMFRITIPQLGDAKTITAFARTTTLPDYELQTAPIDFQGLKINVVTTAKFADTFTVEFLADEAQVLRNRLLAWSAYAYDGNKMVGTMMKNYKADNVMVEQLDRQGNTVAAYRFYGLFPKKVAGYKMSHAEVTPQNFSVDFGLDFYTFDTEAASKGDNVDSITSAEVNGSTTGNGGTSQTGDGRKGTSDVGTAAKDRINAGA